MRKRRLGAGGPEVGAVGLGAMSFGGVYGPTTEAESHATLAAALDLGMDHLDVANIYGMGELERVIGTFLARQGKAREGLFAIATKASISRDKATGARVIDNRPEHLAAELDGSLKRLGVDCVDLFYAHRLNPAVPVEEVAGALGALVQAGKARAIGFSEIAPSTLRRAVAVGPVAAVQSEYSLSTRAPELGLTQACAELGVALVAFSPVGRGLLTDVEPDPAAIAASEFLRVNPRFVAPNLGANLRQVAAFRALAAEMGTTAAALAVAWTLARGAHVLPIPGTRSAAHLGELAAGAALDLSADDLARIEAVLPVGWAHGDRYGEGQWFGPERFC